jgi:hypothetical protein
MRGRGAEDLEEIKIRIEAGDDLNGLGVGGDGLLEQPVPVRCVAPQPQLLPPRRPAPTLSTPRRAPGSTGRQGVPLP